MSSRCLHLLVVLATTLPACAPMAHTTPAIPRNHAQALEIPAPQTVVERALSDWIDNRGWWLAKRGRDGMIIAVSPTGSADGLVTRERWIFRIAGETVTVQSFLDYVRDGLWQTSDEVCATYRYFRENEALHEISVRAAGYAQARGGTLRPTPTRAP